LRREEVAKGAIPFIKARLTQTDTTLKLDGRPLTRPYQLEPVISGSCAPTWVIHRTITSAYRMRQAKINLNKADYDTLMKLPDMTSELAASITSWRNPPALNPYGGAESEYYFAP